MLLLVNYKFKKNELQELFRIYLGFIEILQNPVVLEKIEYKSGLFSISLNIL